MTFSHLSPDVLQTLGKTVILSRFLSMEGPTAPQPPCPSATVLSLQPASPICHPACPGVPWDRTQISYFTALASDAYVVLLKENHMQLIEVATLDRKSGAGEGPAVHFTSNQFQLEAPPLPIVILSEVPRRSVA